MVNGCFPPALSPSMGTVTADSEAEEEEGEGEGEKEEEEEEEEEEDEDSEEGEEDEELVEEEGEVDAAEAEDDKADCWWITIPEPALTLKFVQLLMLTMDCCGVLRGLPGPGRASRSRIASASAALVFCCFSRCACLLAANSFCLCWSCCAANSTRSSALSRDTLV
jgi:hypothetical protein